MQSLGQTFLDTAIRRARYYKDLGDKSFAQLQDADFYYRPNDTSNSISVIIQHMSGNMLSRWTEFLVSDGEKEWRDRDTEFAILGYSKEHLLDRWEKGWTCYLHALTSLDEQDLLKIVYIRKEELLVIDAINRQMAHYPYHVGQIVYIAKLILDNNWKNLSIEPGKSQDFNEGSGVKDPAKKF